MADDGLREGIALFNTSRYFEAHEVWEDLWRQSSGPSRDHCQGLIHAAVGLYHIQRRNRTGARNQLKKCLEKLRRNAASEAGIDNPELIRRIEEILRELETAEGAEQVMNTPPTVHIRQLSPNKS